MVEDTVGRTQAQNAGPAATASGRTRPRVRARTAARRVWQLLSASLVLLPRLATAHVTAPEVLESPTAAWPGKAEDHDVVVPVVLTVDETGTVTDVEVEVSLGPEWDAAARAAASAWKFVPALQDGEPHPARVRALVRFVAEPKAEVPTEVPPAPTSKPAGSPSPSDGPAVRETAQLRETAPRETAAPVTASEPRAPRASAPAATTEVTVRGTTRPRTSSEKSVRRDVLAVAPHRSGSDLLRTVPGVFISQHGGEGKAHQIFFRGYDAVHGQDLAVDVAGLPVNEVSNIHGQGYADLNFVVPEVVERIDVLPGPFAPEQGDFAVSGSLRFTLGVTTPGLTTLGSYGQFDSRRLLLLYHPEAAPSTTFGAAEVYETAGFGPHRAASRANALVQHVVSLSERDHVRVFASVHAGQFDSAGVVRLRDVRSGEIDRFGSYDPNQGGSSSRSQAVAEWTSQHADWQLQVSPYVAQRTLNLRYNYTGALRNPPALDTTLQAQAATTVGLRATHSRKLAFWDGQTQVLAGVEGRRDEIEQSQRFAAEPAVLDARVNATHVGGWLELVNSSVDRLSLRAGARFDSLAFAVTDRVADAWRSSGGTRLGPKASMQLLVLPELSMTLAYGSGFRSPQARSLADGERTPFTGVQALELGTRFDDGTLSANLAGFVSRLEQDLVFNETTSRNDPVQATERLGVTADARWVNPNWLLSCGLTFTRATFTEDGPRYNRGELVPYAPQWVGRCDLGAHRELFELFGRAVVGRVGGATNLLAQRPLPYGETGSTYVITDSSVQLDYDLASLRLDVSNVFDARWNDGEFVYSSAFPGVSPSEIPERHVTTGAPRMWLLSLTLRM